jgi:hypothetical protein
MSFSFMLQLTVSHLDPIKLGYTKSTGNGGNPEFIAKTHRVHPLGEYQDFTPFPVRLSNCDPMATNMERPTGKN